MSELDDEKRFYERFWTLLRDPDLMIVFERFGPAAFRRSSVLEGFEDFIRANEFRGECCVEIGTCKGLTALVLSRYFRRVVSIDTVEDRMRAQIAEALCLNIEWVVVRDNAEKARVINSLQFDAAYVDGDHANDTETDFALVERGGRALLHEHWAAQPPVVRLVERLRARGDRVTTAGKFALWTR